MNHQPYQEPLVPNAYLNNLENKKQETNQESEIDKEGETNYELSEPDMCMMKKDTKIHENVSK